MDKILNSFDRIMSVMKMRKRREIEKLTGDKALQNLKNLITSEVLSEICEISIERELSEIIKQIHTYKKTDSYSQNKPSDCTVQSGRLWILVEIKNENIFSLNVGQSLDIISEIHEDVMDMYDNKVQENGQNNFYYTLRSEHDGKLVFYEIAIDNYLARMYGKSCEIWDITKVIYDMAKEYMAEATIAYSTGAIYWNYYNSGMDKRAYYHLLDDEEKKFNAELNSSN